MLIRAVQAADFDAIAEITNHYIVHTSIHWGYEPVTAAVLCGRWEARRETHPLLVAIAEGTAAGADLPSGSMLGFARSGPWRYRAAYSRTAEVGIYLRPDMHGQGIGRTLYSALIEGCRDRGFHVLVAGIALPNDPSIRLHERLGFVYVGTFREVGRKFDRWLDSAFYQLSLG